MKNFPCAVLTVVSGADWSTAEHSKSIVCLAVPMVCTVIIMLSPAGTGFIKVNPISSVGDILPS